MARDYTSAVRRAAAAARPVRLGPVCSARADGSCPTHGERSCTIVNMCLHADDRTARARIRDGALELFAAFGPDAVTVRGIAARAGVSPSLVIRHYNSKNGVRSAVDAYVVDVFEAMMAQVSAPSCDERSEPAVPLSFVEMVTKSLPHDSAIPGYLGRMLIAGDPAGSALFQRLHDVSKTTFADMIASGSATLGHDPDVRAAFLLVSDLAVMILRDRLTEVLGVDPISPDGLHRWGTEVLSVYRGGLLHDAAPSSSVQGRGTDLPTERQDERNRSEEHTSELQSRGHLVCRLLLEKKKKHFTRAERP